MKFAKIFFLISFIAAAFIPLNLAKAEELPNYDYTKGLTDQYPYTSNHTTSYGYHNNNISWGMSSAGSYWTQFDSTFNIGGLYVASSGITTVNLYRDETIIASYTLDYAKTSGDGWARSGFYYYLNPTIIGINKISWNSRARNNEVEFFGAENTSDIVPPNEVTSLNFTSDYTNITANWNPSTSPDLSHYEVYLNDELINDNVTTNSYVINGLKDGQTYQIKIVSVDKLGNKSVGVTGTVKTLDGTPPKDITNLKSEAQPKSVKFTWENPEDEDFSTVVIYKDGEKVGESSSEAFEARNLDFETSYTFKFISVDTSGNQSKGVQTTVKTLPEPPPTVGEPGFEQKPNGDYVVTWEEPTTGKMRIIVGGKTYAEVPASQKTFTVPGADLKYNFLGEPDVRLQPISDTGKEGDPIVPPSDLEAPFTPKDLILTGNGLLLLIAPFLLLALSFLLVPKLRRLIFSSLKGTKNIKDEPTGRTGRERALHEGRQHLRQLENTQRSQKESREREERQSKVNEPIILAAAATPIKENDRKIREPRERPRIRVRRERQPRVSRERVRAPREPREPRTSRREL